MQCSGDPRPPSPAANTPQTGWGSNPPPSTSAMNESWRRAQDALKSIGGAHTAQQATSTSIQPPPPHYATGWGMPAPYLYSPPPFAPPVFNVPPPFPPPYAQPPAQIPGASQRNAPRFSQPIPYPVPTPAAQPPRHAIYPPRPRAPRPIRFVIAKQNEGHQQQQHRSLEEPQKHLTGSKIPPIPSTYPPIVRDYVMRAYGAIKGEDDQEKLANYIKQRIDPLIKSGAVHAVNWAAEPLPHELNFTIRTGGWIPASKMKEKFDAFAQQKATGPKQQRMKQQSTFPSPGRVDPQPGMWSVEESCSAEGGQSKQGLAVEEIPIPESSNASLKKGVKKLQKKKKTQKANLNWSVAENTGKRDWRSKRFATEEVKPTRHRLNSQLRKEYLTAGRLNGEAIVVGCCMEVEKPYFRLTAAPDPSQVRPLRILMKALELVKIKYKANSDYRYASDQLKSIRQDLMIQTIRNDFTLLVYESNVRIALENKDIAEYNQCQNQLRLLYTEVEGPRAKNRWEFTAYRLLYYIYMRDTLDVSTLLNELTLEALNDECMSFALRVWEAWSMANFVKLFQLYGHAPKMTGYVMDLFVERERRSFLSAILKAYRPGISIATLAQWLGMTQSKVIEWLVEKEIKTDAGGTLDCRQYANIKL